MASKVASKRSSDLGDLTSKKYKHVLGHADDYT